MRPDFIPVGAVVNAHGIRGEVKVNPAGFDPEFIASFPLYRRSAREGHLRPGP